MAFDLCHFAILLTIRPFRSGRFRYRNRQAELDYAIMYVTTIKKRFSDEPETYEAFREILRTYQKERRGVRT